MNQFPYKLQPTRADMLASGPTAQEAEVIQAHFDYLQGLVERNVVLLAGRTMLTDENAFGIVVFEAVSESSARAIMENDPAIARGVMDAQLFPFGVALWSEHGPTGA